MAFDAPIGTAALLRDEIAPKPVVVSDVVWQGLVFDVRRDRVDLGTEVVTPTAFCDRSEPPSRSAP